MRKILFAVVASSAVLALAPTTALARSHHHRGHHRAHRTHARVRHEHFGSWDEGNTASNSSAQNAGMVASFSNGVLKLTLTDGSMVSGQVTGATEIKCDAGQAQEMEHQRHADGDHGGWSNGGDDNGDNNDDHGQDEQGAPMCSTANLAPGAIVRDAELTITGSGASWKELELAGQGQ